MEFGKDWLLSLQLFAEGGEGGAAGEGTEAAGTDGAEGAAPDKAALFQELITGEYKEEFGKHVNGIVKKRTAAGRAAQSRLNDLAPALEYLAQRYDLPIDSPDLVARIVGDKSLIADKALKNGRDEDTEYAIAQAQMQTQKANAMLARVVAQQDYERWSAEAEQLQQDFPGFNLDQELEDQRFVDLLRNYNVGVKAAFLALHSDDALAHIAQTAKQKASAAAASGQNRPKENGAASRIPAKAAVDPMKMSKAEFKAMEEAVLRGERVSFG